MARGGKRPGAGRKPKAKPNAPQPLENPRWERFAQGLAKGQPAVRAYAAAGFKADTGAASRLSAKVSVQARVREIVMAGAAMAEVTVERVLREYGRIGFADIRRAVKWRSLITEVGEDEDGVPLTRAANEVALVGSDDMDEDTALAIAEIAQTKDGALKVKFHSKLGALDSMARHLGMFRDEAEPEAADESARKIREAIAEADALEEAE